MNARTMAALVKSEWIKLTTTRLLLWMGLAACGYAVFQLVVQMVLAGMVGPEVWQDEAFVNALFGAPGAAVIFVLILGIVSMTSEFRHQTATTTFLASPRRERALAAKAIVLAVVAMIVAVLVFVLTTAITLIVLSGKDHAALDWSVIAAIFGGVLLGYAVFAMLGVALGALLIGQAVAIVVAVLWLLLVEPLISAFKPEIGKWLPGNAMDAVLQASAPPGVETVQLSVWAGVAVLLAYVIGFSVIAAATTLRRDIT